MSDFDSVLAAQLDYSPFGDPSVQQARGGGSSQAAGEFNPFDRYRQQQLVPPPPAYTISAQQRISSDELERRQRELEAKSRELELREAEQRRRDEEKASAAGVGSRLVSNWPPLPSFCPIGPCFYQDFDLEIPANYRLVVKIGYYLWIAHTLLLLLNIIGTATYFGVVGGYYGIISGTVFGVSVLTCIIHVPCSYLCWFRPLYKAIRSDSSLNFCIFFLLFMVQILILIVQCLGLNYLGSCGWINSISTVRINLGAGIFMMVIAGMFTLLTIFDILLIIRVHRIYRGMGASLVRASEEFSHTVAANEAVRGAAANAASSTFSTMAGGSRGGMHY